MNSQRLVLVLFLIGTAMGVFAQQSATPSPKSNAIAIGLFQGGGGLIGVDYERLIAGGLGVQAGVGLVSFGAGLTYHFEETADSNALWLGLWNQGIPGDTNSTTYWGISYIMRGWGWLNGQLGLAYVPFRGAQAAANLQSLSGQSPPPIALLYSLGWYKVF